MIKKTRNQKSNKLETKTEKTPIEKEKSVEILGLHRLSAPKGMNRRKRILGRGPSSGHGKTSTRGSKGQTSRAGRDMYLGFEGGQTPLIRRMPKRGFVNKFKKSFQIINLDALNKIKDALITLEILEKEGLIKDKNKPVKILSDGQIKKAVTIQAHAFSKKAQDKILEAGGKFEVLNV
ncbi:MAG: 50S ribosomal protein L15 [Candidatus Omnitrophota bacterium]